MSRPVMAQSAPTSRTYVTNFPLTEWPISEGDSWVNGGLVGLDWSDISTTPGLAIGHQGLVPYSDATAILAGPWGTDQAVTGTVYSVNQNGGCNQEVELRLRTSISPHSITGYEVNFKASTTTGAYAQIVRWNGPLGDFTRLLDKRGPQYGVKNGDVVSACMIENVITVYKNGLRVGEVTDNTYATGSPGMGFNLKASGSGCADTNGDYGFTSVSATDDIGPFDIGDRVAVVESVEMVNAHATPSLSAEIFGTQPARAPGRIRDGPITADGHTWWSIDYDTGADGWTIQDHLQATPGS
ncbi:MAG TPA: hypothetical protein VH744_13790, partial [Terriglobales bacterium]